MVQNILTEVANLRRMINIIKIGEITNFSPIINFVIFGIFIFFGLQVGQVFVGGPVIKEVFTNPRIPDPTATPEVEQRNILIIGVDRLNTQGSQYNPRLESLWMAYFSQWNPLITFVPIYPLTSQEKPTRNGSPQDTFSLNLDGTLGSEFVKQLEQDQVLWNSYVILDEISMIEIINMVGCPGKGDCQPTGALILGDIPRPWEDNLTAAQGQTDLVKKLCIQASKLTANSRLGRILSLIPRHLRTDLDPTQLLEDWQEMSSTGNNFQCELPVPLLSLSSSYIQNTP